MVVVAVVYSYIIIQCSSIIAFFATVVEVGNVALPFVSLIWLARERSIDIMGV